MANLIRKATKLLEGGEHVGKALESRAEKLLREREGPADLFRVPAKPVTTPKTGRLQSAEDRASEVSGKVDPSVATYSPGIPLEEKKIITPEYFRPGDRIIDMIGDTTMAGPKVSSVGGVPLSNEQQMLGGSDYMRHTGGWANTEKTANMMVKNRIRPEAEAAADEGGRTFLNFSPMGGGASASSRHVTNILQDLMFQADPTARGRQQVLDTLTQYAQQAGVPFGGEWNQDIINNLIDSLPMTKRGDFARKFVLPTWHKQGLPDVRNVLGAVNDPDIWNLPAGMGGHNFSEVSPEALDVFKTDHFDYAGGIPGTYSGSFALDKLLPLEDMQMDWSRARRSDPELARKGREFTGGKSDIVPAWEQRALLTQVPAQRVTNEWIDNAMQTQERLKREGR